MSTKSRIDELQDRLDHLETRLDHLETVVATLAGNNVQLVNALGFTMANIHQKVPSIIAGAEPKVITMMEYYQLKVQQEQATEQEEQSKLVTVQ